MSNYGERSLKKKNKNDKFKNNEKIENKNGK